VENVRACVSYGLYLQIVEILPNVRQFESLKQRRPPLRLGGARLFATLAKYLLDGVLLENLGEVDVRLADFQLD
jgi:hypothetical protein